MGPGQVTEEATTASLAAEVPLLWPETLAPFEASPEARQEGSRWKKCCRDLGLGALLVILFHCFVVQVSVVRGLSMSPSLEEGDRLVVDRVSYSMADVHRFDVVVLRYPRDPSLDFVKRVVGLPGDQVLLQNGKISVNGEHLPEDFQHVVDQQAHGCWQVPEGSYFVLGDNRPVSCDSRDFGMVAHTLLKGRVRLRFWPLDRISVF